MIQRKITFIGFSFLLIPVFLLLVSGSFWLVGGQINMVTFPIGMLLALIFGSLLSYGSWIKLKQWGNIISLLIFIGFLCLFFHDPAFDSNWYHQPGIYLLSHGWNPIYQHHSIHLVDDTANMWIDHYAKGQETICATIVAFTGNMEVGKLGNFFLPISSFMFVILALHKFFKEWSTKKLWGISFIIAFPPIVWNQLFSYYIDFNLYSIVVTAFCSFVLYQENTIKFLLVFVSLLVMALSVKFNMCLWFGLLYIGFMIVFWVNGNRKMVLRIAGVGIVGVIVSVLTFSFNPYITNTIDHHSPVYPLMGGKIMLISCQSWSLLHSRDIIV